MSKTLQEDALHAGVDMRIQPGSKRAYAVAAALELIATRASSPTSVDLEEELNNLSKYADQIQAALKG
ncbi:hypothetical protein ACLEJW_09225 [Pseudomonas sp. SMSB3]|uniref:hypothetical protein n=1 Tax=Pseudomonas sp. SMSB3 TaxID=3390196 RepID=UPI003F86EA5F